MIKIDQKKTTVAFFGTTSTLVNEMCNGLVQLLREIRKNTPDSLEAAFGAITGAFAVAATELDIDIGKIIDELLDDRDEEDEMEDLRNFVSNLDEKERTVLLEEIQKKEGKHLKNKKNGKEND